MYILFLLSNDLQKFVILYSADSDVLQNPSSLETSSIARNIRKPSECYLESSGFTSGRSAVALLFTSLSERIRASLSLPPVPRPLNSPLSYDSYLAHFSFTGRLINPNKFR